MKTFVKATFEYERWLRTQTVVVEPDLKVKHEKMAKDEFQFFRATFYRWAELWPQVCPELSKLIPVLGIGDLHIQNFGTWRDLEGRLVWGVNDFDEACYSAFASDLVRLAVSAELAASVAETLALSPKEIIESILDGYAASLNEGGNPFVLDRDHAWLLRLARSALKEPKEFWAKWFKKKSESVDKAVVPLSARTALRAAMPRGAEVSFRCVRTDGEPKGLGSLGRQRFFAVTESHGGPLVREAKAVVPSADAWARAKRLPEVFILSLLHYAVRSPDPFIMMSDNWLVRPVAADCGRINLDELDQNRPVDQPHSDELKLLRAMGFEAANIHLGRTSAKKLKTAFRILSKQHFLEAVSAMKRSVQKDHAQWKSYWKTAKGKAK